MMRPLVVAVLLVLAMAGQASAATFTVTTRDDHGACEGTDCASIRAALAAAKLNGAETDTIVVPAGVYRLTGGELQIDTPVIIKGAGARVTLIRGRRDARECPTRVFDVKDATVTISHLTMTSGGSVERGGNLRNIRGNVTLDHVRVTDGHARSGGGLANIGGRLAVVHSLVDDNHASTHEPPRHGGGIVNVATALSGATLTVRDSTIAFNSAAAGGGIHSSGKPGTTTLEHVTLANNTASMGTGGLELDAEQAFRVRASVVSGNVPANCGVPAPISDGANLESGADCGFTAAGDAQNADALLSAALVNAGGATDVLVLGSGSPAIDRAPGCGGSDQREVARPQGAACDAGAFEVVQEPDTVLEAMPATFTFTSSQPGAVFECRLDGPDGEGAFAPCVSPRSYSGLAPGSYRFFVRAIDAAGVADPTPASAAFVISAQATVARPSAGPPEPDARKTVVVDPLRGTVRVKLPGGSYQGLAAIEEIPLGSSVDVRRGVVRVAFEPAPGRAPQEARFSAGIFKIGQKRRTAVVKLVQPLPRCKANAGASAARKRGRRLWGDGKGRFRTQGRYSSATVRGTRWLVQDSCAGTLTRVVEGSVAVRDRVRRTTVLLSAGQRYLAAPPG